MTGEVNTWVAGSAGNWNVAENWSLGHVPTATEVATFDNTSDNNCAVNAAPNVYGISLATGYDGTVTQGAVDIGIGAGGFTQVAGTLTGNATNWVTCQGNATKTSGWVTSFRTLWHMVGSNSTVNGQFAPRGLWITGKTTMLAGNNLSGGSGGILVDSGSELVVNAALLILQQDSSPFVNNGTISGNGVLRFQSSSVQKTLVLGNVTCGVELVGSNSSINPNFVLGADTVLGGSLNVYSTSANLVYFSHGNNYALQVAGAMTIGYYAVVTHGTGVWTFGSFTQNGTSSVFTQGGPVTSGAVTLSRGSFVGNVSYSWTCDGNWTDTASTFTTSVLNLIMPTDGTTVRKDDYTTYIHSITANGNITLTNGVGAVISINGLNIADGKSVAVSSGKTAYMQIVATSTYSNRGAIVGPGTFRFRMLAVDRTVEMGLITAPVEVISSSSATDNRKLTLSGTSTLLSNLTVSSSHASNTTALDLAGKNLQCAGITAGTRGVILGGEGIIKCNGNWDTSVGTWTCETSQVILTKTGTVKTAAENPFYDLINIPSIVTTLASDVTVTNMYALGGSLVPGAYSVTASGQSYNKFLMPVQLKPNLNPVIYPSGKRLMRRVERVQ